MTGRLGVAFLAVVLAACPPSAPVEVGADAAPVVSSGVDAGQDGGALLPDGGGPRAELAVELHATWLDGGTEPVLLANGTATIDSARGFDVLVPLVLTDYRIRVFDWADQVVPSDDVAQPSDGGIAYRIDFVQPLRTGRTYTLLIDAQSGPEIADTAGRSFDDVRLTLSVRGDVEPEPGKRAKTKKKPSRRRR